MEAVDHSKTEKEADGNRQTTDRNWFSISSGPPAARRPVTACVPPPPPQDQTRLGLGFEGSQRRVVSAHKSLDVMYLQCVSLEVHPVNYFLGS